MVLRVAGLDFGVLVGLDMRSQNLLGLSLTG